MPPIGTYRLDHPRLTTTVGTTIRIAHSHHRSCRTRKRATCGFYGPLVTVGDRRCPCATVGARTLCVPGLALLAELTVTDRCVSAS
jgi:hypothetical protein